MRICEHVFTCIHSFVGVCSHLQANSHIQGFKELTSQPDISVFSLPFFFLIYFLRSVSVNNFWQQKRETENLLQRMSRL